MFCPRCNERIAETWSFCPRCGAKLPSSEHSVGQPLKTPFAEIFKDIEKQVKDALGADLSRDIEFFDLKPEFIKKHPLFRSGGFRIKVTRTGEASPNIDIKAFGDIDEKTAEKIQEAIRTQSTMKSPLKVEAIRKEKPREVVENRAPARQVSEYSEPMCETKWLGDHLVVDLDLPDVICSEDIEIKKLGESIEVKAFAGNKGYFKILSIPKDTKLISKRFSRNKLSLKIG